MSDLISRQNIRKFSKLEWFARQVVEGFITGLHKSPFHGFSVEFAEHRHYNPGDSTRHIDWKLYGRTDKFFVKRYEEETNLRCQIIVDYSASMYFPVERDKGESKLSFSVHSAAALTHLFRSQRDAVGLSLFSENVDVHLPPKLSPAHIHRVFDHLQNLLDSKVSSKKTNVAKALHEVADRVHQRSLILLFSDMLLKGRTEQYQKATKMAKEMVFFDRGIPDVHGYLNYISMEFPDSYIKTSRENRYDFVFLMPPWEDIYVQDNERYENFEQALAIHNHLLNTYKALNYNVIQVPTGTVDDRTDYILNVINTLS